MNDQSSLNMEGMRDSLQCPIHLDLLENAKTLPCQHVVCEECIRLWVVKKGELICPTCKRAGDLPLGGVENLPTNFMINGLVEEFNKLGKYGKQGSGNSDTPMGRKLKADCMTSSIEKTTKTYEDKCGLTISLEIQLCDTDSDTFHVSVATPKGKKMSVDEQKRADKVFVSFVPKMCGVHRVEAFLGSDHVKGSPLIVVVHPDGKFLAGVRGQLKSPRDVINVEYSRLLVTDANEGPYACTDWLGHQKLMVQNPPVKGGEDISPFGIFESDDKVYFTDMANNCVYIYSNGKYLSSFGKEYLDKPIGITLDRNKFIYVANQGTNEITIFAPNLALLKSIKVDGGKRFASKPTLACLTLNQAEDKLVVADQGNRCVIIIDIEESKVVHTITTRVRQAMARPCGMAIDKDDNIYTTVVFKPFDQKSLSARDRPSRQKRHGGKGTHPHDYGGWGDASSSTTALGGDHSERGAVLMYNADGYFLGRFGDSELLNPGGICILDEPSLTAAFVVDMNGNGHGSKGPGVKVFRIS